jgi:hypothetical protein
MPKADQLPVIGNGSLRRSSAKPAMTARKSTASQMLQSRRRDGRACVRKSQRAETEGDSWSRSRAAAVGTCGRSYGRCQAVRELAPREELMNGIPPSICPTGIYRPPQQSPTSADPPHAVPARNNPPSIIRRLSTFVRNAFRAQRRSPPSQSTPRDPIS